MQNITGLDTCSWGYVPPTQVLAPSLNSGVNSCCCVSPIGHDCPENGHTTGALGWALGLSDR
jgi:hypothetical protein